MSPALVAARAGLSRGRIEFKQTVTRPGDLISFLLMTGGFLAAVVLNRQAHVPGTQFSLGTATLVSVLGVDIGMYGVLFMADRLVADREDGTLLRAKAIPNGMLGYLIGKVVNISAQIASAVAITLFAGTFLVTGLAIDSPGSWLTLAWVLVLGLLATLPLGAVLGSLFPDTRSTTLILLLPHTMAAAEIGHSWRQLATFGVLSAWAVAGLVLAPIMLRRTARRESGSSVAARREKAMRRL
jgi:ABC-2 type transport system permease protein